MSLTNVPSPIPQSPFENPVLQPTPAAAWQLDGHTYDLSHWVGKLWSLLFDSSEALKIKMSLNWWMERGETQLVTVRSDDELCLPVTPAETLQRTFFREAGWIRNQVLCVTVAYGTLFNTTLKIIPDDNHVFHLVVMSTSAFILQSTNESLQKTNQTRQTPKEPSLMIYRGGLSFSLPKITILMD